MKKRYWIIGGTALIGLASLAGGGQSAASLCSQPATKAVLDQEFISKLSGLGAPLSDDFTVHGKQGEAVVCSVSFELKLLTKESVAQIDKDYKEPTNAAEAGRQALTSLLLPNRLMHASASPGQPLIQRISYRANRTLDGGVLVEVLNFPGARGPR
jgi:hypothetical protein